MCLKKSKGQSLTATNKLSHFNSKTHYLQTYKYDVRITGSNDNLTLRQLNISWKFYVNSKHFPGRYRWKWQRVFFSEHSVVCSYSQNITTTQMCYSV